MTGYLKGFLIGAMVCLLLVSWLAPRSIGWYFEPPVEIGINCRPATEWAMSKLLVAQIVGLALGGFLGVLTVYFLNRGSKKYPSS